MKLKSIVLMNLLWVQFAVGQGTGAEGLLNAQGFGFAPPEEEVLKACPELRLWATQYYVHEAEYDPNGTDLLDKNEQPTGARLSLCDWCDAAVEGTVYTTDSIGNRLVLNYLKASKNEFADCAKCTKYARYKNKAIGKSLWYNARGEYGDGVGGYQLIPYRTLAVDQDYLPIGTVVFVPNAVGVEITLPSGDKVNHDGFFFAADIGGGIKDNHVDVFTGLFQSKAFPFVKSNADGIFEAYIIADQFVEDILKSAHKL